MFLAICYLLAAVCVWTVRPQPPYGCPAPEDIYPCLCKAEEQSGLELVCNDVTDRAQLVAVLSAYFPVKQFNSFSMIGTSVDGPVSGALLRDLKITNINWALNQLSEVTADAFDRTADTIATIGLADNVISTFDFRCLGKLVRLQGLWLENNKLTHIPHDAFPNPTLKTIDLTGNLITTIGKNAFAGVPKLEELVLERNLLTEIGEEAFRIPNHTPVGGISFLTLNLSGNRIASISDAAFEGIKDAIMYLGHNQIRTIPEGAFRPLIDSSHGKADFFVPGNPLVCDCQMKWIVESTQYRSCFKNFQCSGGTFLEQLEVEDLGECRGM